MYNALKYMVYEFEMNIHRMLFIVLLALSCSAYSNENSDSTKVIRKEYKRKAKKNHNSGQIYEAIYFYEKYFESADDDKRSAYALAGLYYDTRNYENANRFYDSVISWSPEKYPLAYYYKGIVSMNLEEYNEAIESFQVFRKLYRGKKDPDDLRRIARELIGSAEWAIAHHDSVMDISIVNLGTSVNKPHIEFAPFPVNDSRIIYGAYVADSTTKRMKVRKLYNAEKVNEVWLSKGELPGLVNHPEYHTGNAVLSDDGQRMYFTRCSENWKGKMICEIYLSEYINGEWSEPDKLPYPINDENYTTTQPTLGKYLRTGSDILYFVSDRPGTRGGMDIWYCIFDKRNNAFKEPRNAGRGVNSRLDECCPFYDLSNRTLYFSSKGHPGFGGFDVYKVTGSSRKWTDISLIAKPINSSFDDTYFSTIDGGEEGFFTSNRPGSYTMKNGSCCDDIFYYKYNECTKLSAGGTVINLTNYDIYDELNSKYNLNLEYPENNAPVSDVPVQLYLVDKIQDEEILLSQVRTDINGRYLFQLDLDKSYKVVVKNYGFFDKVVTFDAMNKKCSDTISIGISQINLLPEITVRFSIYYEHDKSKLTREARATIDTLVMPVFDLFPNAIIEIGSHTDHTGSDSYNIKLSQRRSESVVSYLIRKGVSADRMIAKGYGESQPIAPNTNPDGSDNPEGRKLNRRTELRIIGELSTFYLDE